MGRQVVALSVLLLLLTSCVPVKIDPDKPPPTSMEQAHVSDEGSVIFVAVITLVVWWVYTMVVEAVENSRENHIPKNIRRAPNSVQTATTTASSR